MTTQRASTEQKQNDQLGREDVWAGTDHDLRRPYDRTGSDLNSNPSQARDAGGADCGDEWTEVVSGLSKVREVLGGLVDANIERLARIEAFGNRIDRTIADNLASLHSLVGARHGG